MGILDKCEALVDKMKKNVGGSLDEDQLQMLNDVLEKKERIPNSQGSARMG